MKALLIHLSDLHIKSSDNPIFERIENICKAVQNLTIGVESIFLIITGDVAYSGSSIEYKEATEFIKKIKSWIKSYSKKETEVVVVPGNHDCNYEIEKFKARQVLIKDVRENGDKNIDTSVIDNCCEVQKQFFDFMADVKDDGNIVFSDKLVCINEYGLGAFNIFVNCYNTAWISEFDEKPGTLHFPIKIYDADYFKGQSYLNISVFHHTLNWFNPVNSREFASHIENTSHIVFTGHEHISSKSLKSNLEGTNTYFIEGAELQGQNVPDSSGFNVVIADLSEEKHKIHQYEWTGDIYKLTHVTEWMSYSGKKSTSRVLFQINSDFEAKFLNDVGAQISHRYKSDICLEDIFILPHLRDLMSYKKKDKIYIRDVVEATVLCKIKEPNNRILLIGSRTSGKTTLCKIIFRHYYNNNYVPIYIEGNRLKTASIDSFYKVFNQCYLEQYEQDKFDKFTQLENDNKLLIIDDFDKSKLNPKSRSLLLDKISTYFPNVIITGGDLFQIDEVLSESKQKELAIEEYDQYQILQFGHLLRSKLINRWITLGREESIEEEELIRKHDEAQLVFNTIIGKNYIPSYPIFLLIILQTIEAGRPHDLEESSFGHYYQYLIFDSLNKVIERNVDIDAYYNFLTELAYHLFTKRIFEISKDEFHEFHSKYCQEYAISTSFDSLIDIGVLIKNLINAGVIEDIDGVYTFRYPYIFNFFTAKYLANTLTENKTKQIVSNMCLRLYREEFADIIMFLTHHSRDSFILENILKNAKSLFAECMPIKFEDDMSTVNNLLGEIPKLVVESKDIKKHREEKLQQKDIKEFSEKPDSERDIIEIPYIYEPVRQLDLTAKLNVAFKTIQILGQILKNYSGSLKRPVKLALGEEAYMLGLRALNPFYQILKEKKENLVRMIRYIITTEKLAKEDEIEGEARIILFTIFASMSYGFIKVISDSVGSEWLSPTFKEISERNEINSVKLVDVSIKLDFYRHFPYDDLKKVKEDVINSMLPYSLLREMVREYLYMFPTKYKDKQRICELVEISMIDQRVIDAISTQKKLLPQPKTYEYK